MADSGKKGARCARCGAGVGSVAARSSCGCGAKVVSQPVQTRNQSVRRPFAGLFPWAPGAERSSVDSQVSSAARRRASQKVVPLSVKAAPSSAKAAPAGVEAHARRFAVGGFPWARVKLERPAQATATPARAAERVEPLVSRPRPRPIAFSSGAQGASPCNLDEPTESDGRFQTGFFDWVEQRYPDYAAQARSCLSIGASLQIPRQMGARVNMGVPGSRTLAPGVTLFNPLYPGPVNPMARSAVNYSARSAAAVTANTTKQVRVAGVFPVGRGAPRVTALSQTGSFRPSIVALTGPSGRSMAPSDLPRGNSAPVGCALPPRPSLQTLPKQTPPMSPPYATSGGFFNLCNVPPRTPKPISPEDAGLTCTPNPTLNITDFGAIGRSQYTDAQVAFNPKTSQYDLLKLSSATARVWRAGGGVGVHRIESDGSLTMSPRYVPRTFERVSGAVALDSDGQVTNLPLDEDAIYPAVMPEPTFMTWVVEVLDDYTLRLADPMPSAYGRIRIFADDRRAIQRALDQASRCGGGTVRIPAGCYVIGVPYGGCNAPNEPLYVHDNTKVVGDGADRTTLILANDVCQPRYRFNTGTDIFVNSHHYDYYFTYPAQLEPTLPSMPFQANHDIEVSGLTLDGNKENQTALYTGGGDPTFWTRFNCDRRTLSCDVMTDGASSSLLGGTYFVCASYVNLNTGVESTVTNRGSVILEKGQAIRVRLPYFPKIREGVPPGYAVNLYIRRAACIKDDKGKPTVLPSDGNAPVYFLVPDVATFTVDPRDTDPRNFTYHNGTLLRVAKITGYDDTHAYSPPGLGLTSLGFGQAGGGGISLGNASHCAFHDLNIQNFPGDAVKATCTLHENNTMDIDCVRFDRIDLHHNGHYGLELTGSASNIVFRNCYFYANEVNDTDFEHGIFASTYVPYAIDNMAFESCGFSSEGSGLSFNPPCEFRKQGRLTGAFRKLSVARCVFVGNSYGIRVYAGGYDTPGRVEDLAIDGCCFFGTSLNSVDISLASTGSVTNCTFRAWGIMSMAAGLENAYEAVAINFSPSLLNDPRSDGTPQPMLIGNEQYSPHDWVIANNKFFSRDPCQNASTVYITAANRGLCKENAAAIWPAIRFQWVVDNLNDSRLIDPQTNQPTGSIYYPYGTTSIRANQYTPYRWPSLLIVVMTRENPRTDSSAGRDIVTLNALATNVMHRTGVGGVEGGCLMAWQMDPNVIRAQVALQVKDLPDIPDTVVCFQGYTYPKCATLPNQGFC